MGCCRSSFPQVKFNSTKLPHEESLIRGIEDTSLSKLLKRMIGDINDGWDFEVVRGRVQAVEEHYFKYRTCEEHRILRPFKTAKGYEYSSIALCYILISHLTQKQIQIFLKLWFPSKQTNKSSVYNFIKSALKIACKVIPELITHQRLMETYQLEHYLTGLSSMRETLASSLLEEFSEDPVARSELLNKMLGNSKLRQLLSSTGIREMLWEEHIQRDSLKTVLISETQNDESLDTPRSVYYKSLFIPPSRGIPILSSLGSDTSSMFSPRDFEEVEKLHTARHLSTKITEERERSFSCEDKCRQ